MAVAGPPLVRRDAVQPGADRGDDRRRGPRLGSSPLLLERSEHQLDRVEVRRVGREERQPAPCRLDGRSGRASLWTERLSWTTICPGRSCGTSHSLTHWAKMSPLRARGNTSGAVTPSMPIALSSVWLSPWLRGTASTSRTPRGARPRVRVIVIWMLVSSRQTMASAGTSAMRAHQSARCSGRCSVAIRDFF